MRGGGVLVGWTGGRRGHHDVTVLAVLVGNLDGGHEGVVAVGFQGEEEGGRVEGGVFGEFVAQDGLVVDLGVEGWVDLAEAFLERLLDLGLAEGVEGDGEVVAGEGHLEGGWLVVCLSEGGWRETASVRSEVFIDWTE